MSCATSHHQWKLVAPWYRWQHAAVPADGRKSAPVFQKFAGDDFITDFLARPQHSLVFDATDDVVSNLDFVPAVPGAALANKVASLFPVDASGKPTKNMSNAYRSRLAPSDLRKLYLPSHDRHYLVTCELHCDAPGFPTVPRQQVCQAGFVVRRRTPVVPAGKEAQVITEVQKVRTMEANLAELQLLDQAAHLHAPLAGEVAAAIQRQQKLVADEQMADATVTSWPALLAKRQREVAEKRANLQTWYKDNGIEVKVEGWFADMQDGKPSKTLGHWQPLDATQQRADASIAGENIFPLYPLVPDPAEPEHDAAGRTQYYGVVPTGSQTHDRLGHPRFDDQTTYEVRCFVRRHKDCCPKKNIQPDCHGEVVWSDATEPYRLAPPFDLVGTSNRPITIKMPDLRELAAQAATRPRGKFSPVRVLQPQHLCAKTSGGVPQQCDVGGEAICFFSIPLITIVALFVLNIFLPIVVFIFQLWFLLVFRFCIPPQISVAGGVDAALAAQPPGVDLDADIGIEVGGVAKTAKEINDLLKASMAGRIAEQTGEDAGDIAAKLDAFSNGALGPLAQSTEDAAHMPGDPKQIPPELEGKEDLAYEPHRTPAWTTEQGNRL